MNELSQKLFLRRRELKISQEFLAKRLGVTAASICHWEMNRRFPKFPKLFEWVDALGYRLEINLINK